jgi:murein DD-endopeptidase MepM/ murein hydrolase activator NlpD
MQQAADLANPALGALNRFSDWFENVTGLSKKHQKMLALGGAATIFLSSLKAFIANLGGTIGGILGGVAGGIAGSFFGPVGTVVGAGVGFGIGSHTGRWIANTFGPGSNLGFSAPQTAGATQAAGAFAKAAPTNVSPFASTAGFTIGAFSVVTVSAALITSTTINSALLLPTIGEDNQLSRFVVIEKQAVEGVQFENEEFPNTITYQVSIRPRDNSRITINTITIQSITDTLTVRAKDESLEFEPRIKNKEDFGYGADEQITITPGEALEFEYTQEFTGTVEDASIENRFEIGFTVNYLENNQLLNETTTAFTAESICVGDCPAAAGQGCWPASGIITQLPFGGFSHQTADAYDIAANAGDPVYAPFDGNLSILTSEDTGNALGNSVQIISDQGTFAFGHLVDFADQTSGPVSSGDLIGYVGSTGYSTGPHLHYEIANNQGRYNRWPNQTSVLSTLVPDGSVGLNSAVRSCAEQ